MAYRASKNGWAVLLPLFGLLLAGAPARAQTGGGPASGTSFGLVMGPYRQDAAGPLQTKFPWQAGAYLYWSHAPGQGWVAEAGYANWSTERRDTYYGGQEATNDLSIYRMSGKNIEVRFGPMLPLPPPLGTHWSAGILVGMRWQDVAWSRSGQVGDWMQYPVEVGGDTEYLNTVEVRVITGGLGSGRPTMTLAYVWSRLQTQTYPWSGASRADGPRFLLGIPLDTWPPRPEPPSGGVSTPASSRYAQGISGALIGAGLGIGLLQGTAVLQGSPLMSLADHARFVIGCGVLGSALAVTRASENRGPWLFAARVAGGAAVAAAQGALMRRALDYDLPDPALMLTIPLGVLLPGG